MIVIESLNLSVRFLLELAALGAIAWWGFRTGGAPLGIGAPLVVATFWGLVLSPKADVDLPAVATIALQLAVLAAASAALVGVQRAGLAAALAAVAVANGVLMGALGQ